MQDFFVTRTKAGTKTKHKSKTNWKQRRP